MTRPLFSVIIPTYNRSDFLKEAVESVLRQTVNNFEAIVVNDGGRHPIGLPSDPRIRLITRELNEGLSAARNTGMEVATGKYLTFLDDDDLYLSNRLELALKGLNEAPIALCLFSTFTDTVEGRSPPGGRQLEGYVHDTILNDFAPHCGVIALERTLAPRFDERYLATEDVEWWLRLSSLGSVTTIAEVGYLQRGHSGPRNLNSAQARLEFSRKLLSDYEDYFATHRKARSFRLQRNGIRELSMGLRRQARRSLLKSIFAKPSIRGVWHLVRSLGPDRPGKTRLR